MDSRFENQSQHDPVAPCANLREFLVGQNYDFATARHQPSWTMAQAVPSTPCQVSRYISPGSREELLQRSPSSLSEWSDPRERPARKNAENNSGVPAMPLLPTSGDVSPPSMKKTLTNEEGISIPFFLQPLLGLEFVPYLSTLQPPSLASASSAWSVSSMPSSDMTTSPSADEDLTMDEEDDEELLSGENENANRATAPALAGEMDVQVGLERPSTATASKSPKTPKDAVTGDNKTKKKLSKRIGATFSAIKQRRALHASHSPSPSHSLPPAPPELSDGTPRRKGGAPSLSADVFRWMNQQEELLVEQQERFSVLRLESKSVQRRAAQIERNISLLQTEAAQLQKALAASMKKLHQEAVSLDATLLQLRHLEEQASEVANQMEKSRRERQRGHEQNGTSSLPACPPRIDQSRPRAFTDDRKVKSNSVRMPIGLHVDVLELPPEGEDSLQNRRRAHTEPRLWRLNSSSFMRVADLDLESVSSPRSSPSSLSRETSLANGSKASIGEDDEFFLIERDPALVLDQLFKLGYSIATDESQRFEPSRETRRLLEKHNSLTLEPIPGWPIQPWHVANEDDVLVWTGSVSHKGFGHDWPVIKARGIVHAQPRQLLEFLLDSKKVRLYNKMSQGREDLLVLQHGIDTAVDQSNYGFAGEARITRSLNKPKLLPMTIETLSLWYAKPVEDSAGSYMIVNRSVWEDKSGTHSSPSNSKSILRSEMLLGVFLVRPCQLGCELTTITHVYAPGLPEAMVKRMAPGSATTLFRELQGQFPSQVT